METMKQTINAENQVLTTEEYKIAVAEQFKDLPIKELQKKVKEYQEGFETFVNSGSKITADTQELIRRDAAVRALMEKLNEYKKGVSEEMSELSDEKLQEKIEEYNSTFDVLTKELGAEDAKDTMEAMRRNIAISEQKKRSELKKVTI